MKNRSLIIKRVVMRDMADITKVRYRKKMHKILDAICERFPNVRYERELQQKHFLWIKNHWLAQLAKTTQRDYLRAVVMLIRAIFRGHWLRGLGLDSQMGRSVSYTITQNKKGAK